MIRCCARSQNLGAGTDASHGGMWSSRFRCRALLPARSWCLPVFSADYVVPMLMGTTRFQLLAPAILL